MKTDHVSEYRSCIRLKKFWLFKRRFICLGQAVRDTRQRNSGKISENKLLLGAERRRLLLILNRRPSGTRGLAAVTIFVLQAFF